MRIMSSASMLAAACLISVGTGGLRADVVTGNINTQLAGPVTQTGSFSSQSEVFEDSFSVSSYTDFKSFTTSYGGGNNVDGSSTVAGGFQPNLTLYTGAGNYVAGQKVVSPFASSDPTSGLALDSYLNKSDLAPGSYILVLTDWLNQQAPTATNLSDGFVDAGNGSAFIDEMNNTRSSNFALNLSASAVPEPATLWLVAPAVLLAFGSFRKRRNGQVPSVAENIESR